MSPEDIFAMQLAAIFEVAGRESDIGWSNDDSPNQSHVNRFHHASLQAYDQYCTEISGSIVGLSDETRVVVREAFEKINFADAKTERSMPYKLILERCHDLDLYRCYGGADGQQRMQRKIQTMTTELGGNGTAAGALATMAIGMIRATGDRVYPPGADVNWYDEILFPLCSTNASECISHAQAVMPALPVPGETKEDHSLGRLFNDSNFKKDYEKYNLNGGDPELYMPERSDEILGAVGSLIDEWCKIKENDRKLGRAFMKRLEDEVFSTPELILELRNDVASTAERFWTCPFRYGGNGAELCAILREALTDDHPQLTPHAAKFFRSLNTRLVIRGPAAADRAGFPEGGILYRGAAIADKHLNFYRIEGRKFRVPTALATAYKERTPDGRGAQFFLESAWRHHESNGATRPGVMFRIQVDPRGEHDVNFRCKNAALIVKRLGVGEEFEYLFSPYSVFTVTRFVASPTPNYVTPHVVYLRAATDNALEPSELPLAPR